MKAREPHMLNCVIHDTIIASLVYMASMRALIIGMASTEAMSLAVGGGALRMASGRVV